MKSDNISSINEGGLQRKPTQVPGTPTIAELKRRVLLRNAKDHNIATKQGAAGVRSKNNP